MQTPGSQIEMSRKLLRSRAAQGHRELQEEFDKHFGEHQQQLE
jgi:hypothetical protein